MRLQDQLGRVVGLDLSEGMLDIFKRKISDARLSEKMTGVAHDLLDSNAKAARPADLRDESFSLIFSQLAFHHISDCKVGNVAVIIAVILYLSPFLPHSYYSRWCLNFRTSSFLEGACSS
jgi:hypothetical protein